MKILVTLVVLINLLGFLMMTNIPDRSAVGDDPVEPNSFIDHNSLVLLSELSAQEPKQKPDSDSESDSVDSLENPSLDRCELLGPFVDRAKATAALGILLPAVSTPDDLIISFRPSEFWLKLPLAHSLDIAPSLWGHFAAKKRYLEDCMKVANRLEFH